MAIFGPSGVKLNSLIYVILALWAVNGLSIVCWGYKNLLNLIQGNKRLQAFYDPWAAVAGGLYSPLFLGHK